MFNWKANVVSLLFAAGIFLAWYNELLVGEGAIAFCFLVLSLAQLLVRYFESKKMEHTDYYYCLLPPFIFYFEEKAFLILPILAILYYNFKSQSSSSLLQCLALLSLPCLIPTVESYEYLKYAALLAPLLGASILVHKHSEIKIPGLEVGLIFGLYAFMRSGGLNQVELQYFVGFVSLWGVLNSQYRICLFAPLLLFPDIFDYSIYFVAALLLIQKSSALGRSFSLSVLGSYMFLYIHPWAPAVLLLFAVLFEWSESPDESRFSLNSIGLLGFAVIIGISLGKELLAHADYMYLIIFYILCFSLSFLRPYVKSNLPLLRRGKKAVDISSELVWSDRPGINFLENVNNYTQQIIPKLESYAIILILGALATWYCLNI